MQQFAVKPPTIPIPFQKLLEIVDHDAPGVFEGRIDGRITCHTYAVRE